MKHILFTLIIALTLGSCADHHTDTESQHETIGLNVVVDNGGSTRAGADLIHGASDVGSIGLYAYITRANGTVELIGENLKLNYVEGETLWEWDDKDSVPVWGTHDGSERYTFYSYAPYREDGSGVNFDAERGEFSLDYTMSDNQDLMIARLSDIVHPVGGVVTLDLRHTLSAVALNTTYYSVITKVELVTSDDYYALMPISGKVSLNESGEVEWHDLGYNESSERYEMASDALSHIMLLPQQTTQIGDLFFSITSKKNNQLVVDENAKIPQMRLISHGIYKFNYKEPYFELDENDLVVDMDAFNKVEGDSWNDYSYIDKIIAGIKDAGHSTVILVGEPKDPIDAYHVISHIVQNGGLENYDFSKYIVPDKTTLPYNLFQKNTTIKNIVMPVLDAGQMQDNSFWGCTSLESVKFPEGQGLKMLPNSTFKGCISLTSVKLDTTSDAMTKIGQDAFNGCVKLEEMELPRSIDTIGYASYNGCRSLSKINIPAAVTYIYDQAFMGCTSLYSYGENSGIVFDPRSAQDKPIKVGWHGFFNTHVRYNDIPAGYVDSATSDNGYFSEP